jgi:hypothetical protein
MHRMRFSSPTCCLTDVDPKQQLAEASSGVFRLEAEEKETMRRGLLANQCCMLFLVGLVYEMAPRQDLGGANNS